MTLRFSRDFLSYEVEVPNLAQAIKLVDADWTIRHVFSFKNHTYVPLKYYVGDVTDAPMAASQLAIIGALGD